MGNLASQLQLPGQQFIDPRMTMGSRLVQNGEQQEEERHWAQGLSRMAQQLLGSYMIGQSYGDKNTAMSAFGAKQPDTYTETPTYKPEQVQDFINQASGGISEQPRDNDKAQEYLKRFEAPTLAPEPQEQITEENFGPQRQGPVMPSPEYPDWNRMPDLTEHHRVNTYANVPNADPKADIAKLMEQSQTPTLDPKMPQMDYVMQLLSGMKGNPYAQNLVPQLAMAKMDRDYAAQLAGVSRAQQLADIKSKQDFTAGQDDKKMGNARDIANIKKGGGPYSGTSMDAQNLNILLNGDPNSPIYQAAYSQMAQPKSHIDPTTGQVVSIKPDMSPYRIPSMVGGVGQQPVQGTPQDYSPSPQGQPGQPSVSVQTGTGRTKPYNEFQSKSAGFYNRMMDANTEINNIFAGPDGKQGTPDDLTAESVYSWDQHAKNSIPVFGNAFTSDNFQRAQQAQRNWVSANLRLESGAAIPPAEQEQEFRKYFPVYGDSKAVIEQKARARKQVEMNMRTQSQGAYESMYENKKPSTPNRRQGEPNHGWKMEKIQ